MTDHVQLVRIFVEALAADDATVFDTMLADNFVWRDKDTVLNKAQYQDAITRPVPDDTHSTTTIIDVTAFGNWIAVSSVDNFRGHDHNPYRINSRANWRVANGMIVEGHGGVATVEKLDSSSGRWITVRDL